MARTVIAVFDSIYSAKQAVWELLELGFPRERIDLFADHVPVFLNELAKPEKVRSEVVVDEIHAGAIIGAGLGESLGITGGLLIYRGVLSLPLFLSNFTGEIQAVVLFLLIVVLSAVLGGVAGGLVSGLFGLGIPENEIRQYAKNVHKGSVTLMIVADWDAVDGTLEVLGHHNPLEIKQRSIALQRAVLKEMRLDECTREKRK